MRNAITAAILAFASVACSANKSAPRIPTVANSDVESYLIARCVKASDQTDASISNCGGNY